MSGKCILSHLSSQLIVAKSAQEDMHSGLSIIRDPLSGDSTPLLPLSPWTQLPLFSPRSGMPHLGSWTEEKCFLLHLPGVLPKCCSPCIVDEKEALMCVRKAVKTATTMQVSQGRAETKQLAHPVARPPKCLGFPVHFHTFPKCSFRRKQIHCNNLPYFSLLFF